MPVLLPCSSEFNLYLLKKKGEVGCRGRATPVHNTPHPDLLKRCFNFSKSQICHALREEPGFSWLFRICR